MTASDPARIAPRSCCGQVDDATRSRRNRYCTGAEPALRHGLLLGSPGYSVRSRFDLDDVGIGTRAISVVRSQTVVIIRAPRQARNASICREPNVQVLIARHITGESSARGDIQSVTTRTGYTA